MQRIRLATTLAVVTIAVSGIAGPASALDFTVTVENWGPQPFTPVFVSTGNSMFDIFDAGTAASASLQALAEGGDVSGLLADAAAAQGAGHVLAYDVIHPGSPLLPGEMASIVISADPSYPWLSLASMLAMTNDGFWGSAVGFGDQQINLYQGGMPLTADWTISYLMVWDAGTEVNDELAENVPGLGGMGHVDENGVIMSPHAGILGIGDVPLDFDWYGYDVGRVTITPVPEPSLIGFAGLGLGLLGIWRRRK